MAGTEVLTLGVARELRRRGHVVRIVSGHPGSSELNEANRWVHDLVDGFEVDRFHHADVPMLGQNSIIEIGSDNPLAARHFARVLHLFQPDQVHYFHLGRLGTGLILEAESARVRQSFTPTDFWAICPFGQLQLPNGDLCGGPSINAGNCVKHYAQSPNRSAAIQVLARSIPVALADALVPLTKAGRRPCHPMLAEVRALSQRLPKTISRLNRLQTVVVPNAFMRTKLLEYGLRDDLIVESAFGVDLPDAGSGAIVEKQDNQPLRIGYIGTLAPHKGAQVLISAFKLLSKGTCTLRIYGNVNEYPDYSKKLANQSAGRSDIEFAGTFPNTSISTVLADIDVVVVPSLWYENTPLIVYSAQAARKVIVASNLPGLAAAIQHDVNGLLFPAGDVHALAKILRKLSSEPALRKSLAMNIRTPRSTTDYVDDLLGIWYAS